MIGMRTHGRRSSNSSNPGDKRVRADSNPVVNIQEASVTPGNGPVLDNRQAPITQEVNQGPLIAPNFSRNAEMETRRKARIQARNALAELRAHNLGGQDRVETEIPVPEAEDVGQEVSSESDSDSDFDDMGVAPDEELDP
jgi:hypothetical protein